MVGWIGDPDFVVLLNQARIGKEFRFVQPDLVAHSRHALRLAGKQVENGRADNQLKGLVGIEVRFHKTEAEKKTNCTKRQFRVCELSYFRK